MAERFDRPSLTVSVVISAILIGAALLLILVQGSCAHTAAAPTWRDKGLQPATSTADAIEASFGSRRVALVIGVGDYDDPLFTPLRHAGHDAIEFGDILESHDYGGFDRVITLTTPVQTTQARILSELVSLKNDLRSQDTLIVYFSGHGTMKLNSDDEPTLYLVTSDATARDLPGTALELGELQAFFTRIHAERKALVIDACFHGQGKSRVQPTVQQHLESMDAYPTLSRRVRLGQSEAHLFATSWGRPAREDDTLEHGVYTYYLLQGLTWSQDEADANGDGLVTIYEAHDYARGETVAFTDGAQVPEAYFRVVGEKDLIVAGEPEKRLESQLALIYFYDSADSAFIGARLSVDGREKGVFPGSVLVDPGRHRISIVSADGSMLFDRVIDIDYSESIPADMIDSRPQVYRTYLGLMGGPMLVGGERLMPLLGSATVGPEVNLGLRFLADPRLTGLSVSFQLGYDPVASTLGDGAVDRHLVYGGAGFGYRLSHRKFALGINWRLRASLVTAQTTTVCSQDSYACDNWLLFGQGPYVEQVIQLNRQLALVLGEELMLTAIDPTTAGLPGIAPTVSFRAGLEFNF